MSTFVLSGEEFKFAEESYYATESDDDYYDSDSDYIPDSSATESDDSFDSDYIPDISATESDDTLDSDYIPDSSATDDSDSDYIPDSSATESDDSFDSDSDDSSASESDYSEPVPVEICIGVLRNGSPSRFAAKHGYRCGHHKLRGDSTRGSLLCVGVLSNGSPCRFKAKHGDRCGHHKLRGYSTGVSLFSPFPNTESIYKNRILPPFQYQGGKSRLLKQLLPLFPTFNNYFEPFIGGGAVCLSKCPLVLIFLIWIRLSLVFIKTLETILMILFSILAFSIIYLWKWMNMI